MHEPGRIAVVTTPRSKLLSRKIVASCSIGLVLAADVALVGPLILNSGSGGHPFWENLGIFLVVAGLCCAFLIRIGSSFRNRRIGSLRLTDKVLAIQPTDAQSVTFPWAKLPDIKLTGYRGAVLGGRDCMIRIAGFDPAYVESASAKEIIERARAGGREVAVTQNAPRWPISWRARIS